MEEVKVDYSVLCQRLMQGLRNARQILDEAERDCQNMFDCAVYAQAEKIRDSCSSQEQFRELRHTFLQNAAEEKEKLLK